MEPYGASLPRSVDHIVSSSVPGMTPYSSLVGCVNVRVRFRGAITASSIICRNGLPEIASATYDRSTKAMLLYVDVW